MRRLNVTRPRQIHCLRSSASEQLVVSSRRQARIPESHLRGKLVRNCPCTPLDSIQVYVYSVRTGPEEPTLRTTNHRDGKESDGAAGFRSTTNRQRSHSRIGCALRGVAFESAERRGVGRQPGYSGPFSLTHWCRPPHPSNSERSLPLLHTPVRIATNAPVRSIGSRLSRVGKATFAR